MGDADRANRANLAITVFSGGIGPEREVSLESGNAVFEALMRLGHRVTLADVSPSDLSALDIPTDFVFIALHGEFGEDGSLQRELERRRIPFCGSGARSSALAMDKVEAKACFERASVPTPAYERVARANLTDLVLRVAVPAVVKPVASGSSVDVAIARTQLDLAVGGASIAQKYGEVLVEAYVTGPELTVGILGDTALPVCEIRTEREFYDYRAKYQDDRTQYLFDLDLPDDLLGRVQRLSLTAHQSLGCAVFSRVDWMVDEHTHEPYVIEVNTIPGFTSHSLVPKAAQRVGIGFDDLCQRIIDLSLAVRRDATAASVGNVS